jgi:PAS domain S-box-containing protein
MAIDITDRKKTEEALQRSNHLFEKALYNLRDAVFVFNTEMDKIIDCNIVATTIFGYSRQEILGLGLADLFDDKEEFDIFKKTLCCTIEEASILGDVNLKMKRKDKTVFSPKCDIMPLGREKGKVMGWVCIIGDIGVKKEK